MRFNYCFQLPLLAHIWLSGIAFTAGTLGSFFFLNYFQNYHAGFWCLVWTIISLICLRLHTLHHYRNLEMIYNERKLKKFVYGGLGVSVISFLVAIVYFGVAIGGHIPVVPVGPSLILGGIQALIATKWALSLFIYSRNYIKLLRNGYEAHQDILST